MAQSTSQVSNWRHVDIMGWHVHVIALLAYFLWRYSNNQPIPFTIIIYPLLLCVSRLEYLLKAHADPREPPLIPHPYLPFIGHITGMFSYGAKYYEVVNKETKHPIYTLRTLTGRTVIVASPQIAAVIQRTNKSLSFYGAILAVTERMVGFDKAAMSIIWDNVDRDAGDHGLMNVSHDMVASVLGPGPVLNSISTIQLDAIADVMNAYVPSASNSKATTLMDFTKHVFTTSNALAFYGPENPFLLTPGLDKAWWTFEDGIKHLIAGVLPTLTAPTAHKARNQLVSAMEVYLHHARYKAASPLIRKRFEMNLAHGMSAEMTARSELILLFAIMGNAVPTTFWLLAHIFSRPDLLATLRAQCAAAVIVSRDGHGAEKRVVSVTKVKEAAPLLVSCFRETLRTIIALTSVRYVREDVLVCEKYLLRKGTVVQMASGVIHSDPSIWGEDAGEFRADRFLGTDTSTPSSAESESESSSGAPAKQTALPLPSSVPSAAFRAFGGGSVICPGRHFALSEIIGFTALVLLGFEIESLNGGVIEMPLRDDLRIPLTPMKPVGDVGIKMRRREGLEEVVWGVEL